MSTFGFGKLNGMQIEYIEGINMTDYYQAGGTFISTKLLQKMMLQFSTSGKLTFSNQELMDTFGVTRRALQISISELETIGILKRTFTDETKYVRTGFILDVDMAIEWLKLTRKDVEDRPRGDLCKHFVMQAVIKVNEFSRKLKKVLRIKDNENKREEIQAKLEDLNKEKAEYEQHLKYMTKRVGKYIAVEADASTVEEQRTVLKDWLKTLEYKPPGFAMN
jgi:hypothetical protein